MIKIGTYPKFIKKLYWIPLVLLCGIVALLWQYSQPLNTPKFEASLTSEYTFNQKEPIQPIPTNLQLNKHQVQLGRKLFSDVRLSRDNTTACLSCHSLNTGGTDRLIHSFGMGQKEGVINAPTVLNSGFNFKQFWDGRADTLEAQINAAIFSDEMGNSSWLEVIDKLKQDLEYQETFKMIYSDGITEKNIKNAIATFEQSLTTPNSRFDQFLQGNKNSITEGEKKGYDLFKAYGCVSCHQGTLVGGNMFQTLGLFGDYFKDRQNRYRGQAKAEITKADLGRYNVTQNPEDRYVFKVPSLRNIVLTYPYFHDGSVPTLEQAIKLMAKYQLGRDIPQEDVDLIIQFLNSLTGELPQ